MCGILLAALIGSAGSAIVSMVAALRELAPHARLSEVLARGIFVSRDQFTELGWRRRNRAIVLQGVALLFLLAWGGACL